MRLRTSAILAFVCTDGLAQVLQLLLLFMEGALLKFGLEDPSLLSLQVQLLLELTISEGEKKKTFYSSTLYFCSDWSVRMFKRLYIGQRLTSQL